jgi:hypothetical protein
MGASGVCNFLGADVTDYTFTETAYTFTETAYTFTETARLQRAPCGGEHALPAFSMVGTACDILAK